MATQCQEYRGQDINPFRELHYQRRPPFYLAARVVHLKIYDGVDPQWQTMTEIDWILGITFQPPPTLHKERLGVLGLIPTWRL